MKYLVPHTFIVVMISCSVLRAYKDDIMLVGSAWKDLEHGSKYSELFDGKWILAGSITFRKKSKETVYLSKLSVRWRGKKLDRLVGSIYKKSLDKPFLPIEEFLVSDSIWNKKKQTLIFNFKESVSLGPTTIFYLVLTVPDSLEETLKQGLFVVEKNSLPLPFKSFVRQNSTSIAYSSKAQIKEACCC